MSICYFFFQAEKTTDILYFAIIDILFSHVLRDSTLRFVCPSVDWLACPLVGLPNYSAMHKKRYKYFIPDFDA